MSKGAMEVGKRATVKVAYVVEQHVEVEMPTDGDPAEQAMFELFCQGRLQEDVFDRTVVHAEIESEETVYEDDYDGHEEWPSYV